MGLSIRDTGGETSATVRECRSGLMALDTRANGGGTRLTGRASSGMWMAMYLMDTGRMIRPMVSVYILMSMEPSMKAIGKMIYSTVGVSRAGLMAASTRVVTKKA